MSTHPRRLRALALVLGLVMAVAACSGDDDSTDGTLDPADVVFGSGSIPDTVPADFPVPEEAVVSSTLVNRPARTTEMILRLPVDVDVVVTYYEENLEPRGYTIVTSEPRSDSGWDMEIEKDDLTVSVRLRNVGGDLTEAVMMFEQ